MADLNDEGGDLNVEKIDGAKDDVATEQAAVSTPGLPLNRVLCSITGRFWYSNGPHPLLEPIARIKSTYTAIWMSSVGTDNSPSLPVSMPNKKVRQ